MVHWIECRDEPLGIRATFGHVTAMIVGGGDGTWLCTFTRTGNDAFNPINRVPFAANCSVEFVKNYAEQHANILDSYFCGGKPNKKKLQERLWLEQVLRLSSIFPEGEVIDSEEPDFLIRTAGAVLGIEVTGLWQEPLADTKCSPREITAYQERVVSHAKKRYDESGADAVDVVVTLSNTVEIKQKVSIESLVTFVREHCASSLNSSTYWASHWGDEIPREFKYIGIHPPNTKGGSWTCVHYGYVLPLTYEQVSNAVSKKEHLLSRYRERSRASWLLLVADPFPCAGGYVSVPNEAVTWRFSSHFEKVLLYSRENSRVFELQQPK